MNPFRFGSVVEEDQFFNREKEVQEIRADLKAGINIIIYSPRRYGKTSLVQKVLKEFEKNGHICIYIDFFKIFSQKRFIELYGEELLKKQNNFKKAFQKFREIFTGIVPQLTFDENGEPKVSFQFATPKVNQKDLTEIVDFPERLSIGSKKVIVVFDEFQEINQLNGEAFEKILRSQIQFHKNTSYVFMGSKTHLLLNMFQNKEKPFYKSGKFYPLGKIDLKEMAFFVHMQFEKSGLFIHEPVAEKLVIYANNIPNYVQQLAYQVWGKAIENKKEVTEDDILNGVEDIIIQQQDYYLEIFNNLSSYQKKVLRAFTISTENIYSSEYASTFDLSSGSSTQRAVAKLVETGIVEKHQNYYTFSDPFFEKFLNLKIFN